MLGGTLITRLGKHFKHSWTNQKPIQSLLNKHTILPPIPPSIKAAISFSIHNFTFIDKIHEFPPSPKFKITATILFITTEKSYQ